MNAQNAFLKQMLADEEKGKVTGMITEQVNVQAFQDAVAVVLRPKQARRLEAVFEAIDKAERRGHASGFDVGYTHGHGDQWDAGYAQGFNEGAAQARTDEIEDSYDAGYEQARRDLGECPTIDADWEDGPVFYAEDFYDDAKGG